MNERELRPADVAIRATPKALDRAAIMAAAAARNGDWPRERIDVPAWGGAVWARALSAGQRDHFETETAERQRRKQPTMFRARLIQLGTEDDSGGFLFGTNDLAWLDGRPGSELDPIVDAIMTLSGMRAKDFADAEKNSGTAPSGAT